MFSKNKEIKEIISTSLINRVLIYDFEHLTSDQIDALAKKADLSRITDDLLPYCEYLYPIIDWTKFEKFKLIRMIARNSKIIKFVDVTKFNFTLRDILPCVKINPLLIHEFNVDLNNLNKTDALELLKTGKSYFIENVSFNDEEFTATESFFIVKNFDFNPTLMSKFKINEKNINPQYLREIIIKTGTEFIEDFNLNVLEPVDWIAILRNDKMMIKYCNPEIFKRGDIFFLIEFLMMFPEYKEWINEENKDKITCLGWEKLLIKFGEEITDICDFSILTEVSWSRIKNERPGLMVYKL